MAKTTRIGRRKFLAGSAAAASFFYAPSLALAQSSARVVVVGGGFGGATFARFLKRVAPSVDVTLVEASSKYVACPFSNLIFGGLRTLKDQEFGYDGVKAQNVNVIQQMATDVDAAKKTVALGDGTVLSYDKLLLAPGVDLDFSGLEGYDAAAAEIMPHAWKAGSQTALLNNQLQSMEDGGVVVIAAPANPFRCPPGPYERASMIAHHLKTNKPKSKLMILDAKEKFSKQALFQQGWQQLYGDLVEWVGLSDGGQVISVDPSTMTLNTDFDSVKAAVANVIPPQKAGVIAVRAGVTDASGWCPIDPVSFESTLQKDIHVLGDASIANAMPKSAFSANAQAKVCAIQVARLLNGEEALPTTLANTCYSLVGPEYGISIADVYRPGANALDRVEGAGGVSRLDAPSDHRVLEAQYADDWFKTITSEVFG